MCIASYLLNFLRIYRAYIFQQILQLKTLVEEGVKSPKVDFEILAKCSLKMQTEPYRF